ncbi:winged helix-turn-helix domain-containing protein [Flindersiella endophytica]
MDELLARLRAARRRAQPGGAEEWHLLEVLARSPGQLVPQKQLLQEVWGPTYSTETNYPQVDLAGPRRELEPDPAHPRPHHRTRHGLPIRTPTRHGRMLTWPLSFCFPLGQT